MFAWEKFNILPESRVLEPKFMEYKIFTPLRKSFLKQSPLDKQRTFQMIRPEASFRVPDISSKLRFPIVKENFRNKSLSRIPAPDFNKNLTVKGKLYHKSVKIHMKRPLGDMFKAGNDEIRAKGSPELSYPNNQLDSLSIKKDSYFSLTPSPEKYSSNLVIQGNCNMFSTPKPSQSTTPYKLFPKRTKEPTDSFLDHFESSIRLYRRIRKHEFSNPRVVQGISASITHKTQSTSPRSIKF